MAVLIRILFVDSLSPEESGTTIPCADYAVPTSRIGNTFSVGANPGIDAMDNVFSRTGGVFNVCEELV